MKISIRQLNIQSILIILYVVVVLFMPNFILNYTTIYSINAEGYVKFDAWQRANPWLYYSFSFVEIPAIVYAIFKKKNKSFVNVLPLIIYLIIWNIFRFFVGFTSVFSYGKYGDYSIILSLLSGFGCFLLVTNAPLNLSTEDALDLIIVLNFITQLLFVLTGRQNDYGGRYPALGSTVGDVGTMCFLYLIYYFFARKKKNNSFIPFFCCLLSLVLSGSRANVMFALGFTIVFLFKLRQGLALSASKKHVLLITFIVFIMFIPLLFLSNIKNSDMLGGIFNRIEDMFKSIFSSERSEYFENDASFSQRIDSIAVGFNILKNNLFGISCSAIELQVQTINYGYYTFPHSMFLSYYLLFGVGCLFIFAWMIYYLVEGIKYKNLCWIVILCFILTTFIYGGPGANSKMYFWYICIFSYCKNLIIDQIL